MCYTLSYQSQERVRRDSSPDAAIGTTNHLPKSTPSLMAIRLSGLFHMEQRPMTDRQPAPITLATTASPPNEWIGTLEASKVLGISADAVRQLTKYVPDFPRPYRPGVKNLKWRRGDMLDWMRTRMLSYRIAATPSSASAPAPTSDHA